MAALIELAKVTKESELCALSPNTMALGASLLLMVRYSESSYWAEWSLSLMNKSIG